MVHTAAVLWEPPVLFLLRASEMSCRRNFRELSLGSANSWEVIAGLQETPEPLQFLRVGVLLCLFLQKRMGLWLPLEKAVSSHRMSRARVFNRALRLRAHLPVQLLLPVLGFVFGVATSVLHFQMSLWQLPC